MEKTVFRTTLPRAECERALDAALETERTDFEHGGRYRAESPVTGWVMGRLFRLAVSGRASGKSYATRLLYGWLGKDGAVTCLELASLHDPAITAALCIFALFLVSALDGAPWLARLGAGLGGLSGVAGSWHDRRRITVPALRIRALVAARGRNAIIRSVRPKGLCPLETRDFLKKIE